MNNPEIYRILFKRFLLSIFSLIISVIITGGLRAQVNRTPGQLGVVLLEPAAYHLQDMSGYCFVTSSKQNYSVEYIRIQGVEPGLEPGVTLNSYIEAMSIDNIGIFHFHSHGSNEIIGVEYYQDDSLGKNARDSAYWYYITVDSVPPHFIHRSHIEDAGYFIGISNSGIQYYQQQLSDAIVSTHACKSASLNDDWGALTACGYDTTIAGLAGVDVFWERMNGQEGIEKRSVGEAAEGIDHLVVYGNEDVVLSPVVKNHLPLHEEQIYEGYEGFIEFDCELDVLINPYDIITVSEEEGCLDNVYWITNTRIEFEVEDVEESGSMSFVVHTDKAISEHNNAMLDGNQLPYDVNGYGPNGDNFVIRGLIPRTRLYNFENGANGAPVVSNLEGVELYYWYYTHPGTSGPGWEFDEGYHVNGYLGGWCGVDNPVGRINFTGATAQEVTIGYSAGRNISLVAYDSDNNMLSYTGGSENYNRGCLWYLTVEDIDIAYVLVCGEANYFLIDDIYVVDLPGITESMLAPNYEIQLEDFTYLDQGNSENYNLNLGDDEALETILNWGEGEFTLKIYDNNEDLYGEWQSDNPPIIADVPYAESGDWEFEVTAVTVPDEEYYALIVGGMEIPLTTSSKSEPVSWLSSWATPQGFAIVKGIIYDMPGGYSVDDIDIESVRLNGTVEDINGEIEVFPSWPGINGSVAVAEFLGSQAVASLGPDPEMGYYTVTLSGEYTNEVPFESETQIHYILVGETPGLFDRPGDLIPKEFFLSQNFPNPFNPITTFNYGLPQDSHVNLTVYNLRGQRVATIVDNYQQAGYKSIRWDASDYSSGIYFYKLTTNNKTLTKRMTLLK